MMCSTVSEHIGLAMHMLKYIKSKRDVGIKFHRVKKPKLRAYFDASNKHNRLDGKAYGGYIIMLCGGPLHWEARKLKHVGLGSPHNEYIAMAACNRKVRHLRLLLSELHLDHWCDGPTTIMGDNLVANEHAREDVVTAGNCYYEKELYFNKEAFERGYSNPVYIASKENLADPFTKNLTTAEHDALVPVLTGHSPTGLPDECVGPDATIYYNSGLDGIFACKVEIGSDKGDWVLGS